MSLVGCRVSGAHAHVKRVCSPVAARRAQIFAALRPDACATVIDTDTNQPFTGHVASVTTASGHTIPNIGNRMLAKGAEVSHGHARRASPDGEPRHGDPGAAAATPALWGAAAAPARQAQAARSWQSSSAAVASSAHATLPVGGSTSAPAGWQGSTRVSLIDADMGNARTLRLSSATLCPRRHAQAAARSALHEQSLPRLLQATSRARSRGIHQHTESVGAPACAEPASLCCGGTTLPMPQHARHNQV